VPYASAALPLEAPLPHGFKGLTDWLPLSRPSCLLLEEHGLVYSLRVFEGLVNGLGSGVLVVDRRAMVPAVDLALAKLARLALY